MNKILIEVAREFKNRLKMFKILKNSIAFLFWLNILNQVNQVSLKKNQDNIKLNSFYFKASFLH